MCQRHRVNQGESPIIGLTCSLYLLLEAPLYLHRFIKTQGPLHVMAGCTHVVYEEKSAKK